MPKLVTIYGGSGFVGRYIAQRMARLGWRVRVAVRRPNEAMFVKPYGSVGQVEPVLCNIRNEGSVRAAMSGADAIVNCVGVLNESGRNGFDAVHGDGATNIAKIGAECGVAEMVHISAIGADANSDSDYSSSKGRGEDGVLKHFPTAVILRPSVIFGPEDQFFNKFASMSRLGPVLPLVGGDTEFQPVYVEDVATAAVQGVLGNCDSGIYELGGPQTQSLSELTREILSVIRRRRLLLNLPFWAGSLVGRILDIAQSGTFGLFNNSILTHDQVRQLREANVVGAGARGFPDLGIDPVSYQSVVDSYLWQYRPSGQYAAIKDSAKNLNT